MPTNPHDSLPNSTAMERMLSEEEARHFVNHDRPHRANLPEPDRVTRTGSRKWFVSTVLETVPNPRVDWRLKRCGGQQVLFYSDEESDIAKAKEVCYGCPLRQACCRVVLSMPVRQSAYGVWAATSAEERIAWRNKGN